MARLRREEAQVDSDPEDDSSIIEQGHSIIELDDSESEESDGSDGSARREPQHGFLDTEALDDSASESDDGEGSDDMHQDGPSSQAMPPFWGHPVTGSCSFPQFIRLPIELRQRVWYYFCNDLTLTHRVLDFDIRQNMNLEWAAYDGSTLMARTTALRAMLAVHHESRALYLKRYPDQLRFSTSGERPATFHFNKRSDIILTSAADLGSHDPSLAYSIPGFSDQILHLGLQLPLGREADADRLSYHFLLSLPNLKVVYPCIDVDDWQLPVHELKWCASDHAVSYFVKTEEIEAGLGENAEAIFAWHDPDATCDAEEDCEVLAGKLGPSTLNIDPDDEDEDVREQDQDRLAAIKLCPMRIFFGDSQVALFDTLCRARRPDKTWDQDLLDRELEGSDDEDDEPDSFLDNYESDGIDDATVPEPETDDDEGTGIEDDTLALELGGGSPGSFNGFSPVEGELEPQDHSVYEILDSSEEEAASPPRSPTKRQRGRQIIVDDSDEEEHVGDASVQEVPAPEPSRGTKRSRVVLSDDDEDEEEAEVQSRPAKRARPVVVDDSDEEEDSDVQEVATRQKGRARGSNSRAPVVLSDSDDDSEEEEESEEDEAPPQNLSLVERLRLHREANPIGNASEDGSGSDDENDYTRGTYDESEEDEEDSNNLVLGMADDGEEDEEDEDVDEDSYYR